MCHTVEKQISLTSSSTIRFVFKFENKIILRAVVAWMAIAWLLQSLSFSFISASKQHYTDEDDRYIQERIDLLIDHGVPSDEYFSLGRNPKEKFTIYSCWNDSNFANRVYHSYRLKDDTDSKVSLSKTTSNIEEEKERIIYYSH